jgi:hypothetical protein
VQGLRVDCPDLSALALLLLTWLPPPPRRKLAKHASSQAGQAGAAGRGRGGAADEGDEDGGGDEDGEDEDEDEDEDDRLLSDESAFALYAATLPTAHALSNAVTMGPRAQQAWAQAWAQAKPVEHEDDGDRQVIYF